MTKFAIIVYCRVDDEGGAGAPASRIDEDPRLPPSPHLGRVLGIPGIYSQLVAHIDGWSLALAVLVPAVSVCVAAWHSLTREYRYLPGKFPALPQPRHSQT